MLVIEPVAINKVPNDPTTSIPIVVEINQPIADQIGAKNNNAVIAAAKMTVVALVHGHRSMLRDLSLSVHQTPIAASPCVRLFKNISCFDTGKCIMSEGTFHRLPKFHPPERVRIPNPKNPHFGRHGKITSVPSKERRSADLCSGI
jgi:hypothetical protein